MTDLRIREIKDSDYGSLGIFNARFPNDTLSAEKWQARFLHWWDYNPAYGSDWKRGFIMEHQGSIVGWVGSFPSFFKANDQIIKAFNGTTWRVIPDYRQWSIDLWSYNRDVSTQYLSFNTTPIEEIIPLIKKFQYRLHPWGDSKVSIVTTDPAKLLRYRLPSKYSWMFKPIGFMLDFEQRLRLNRTIEKKLDVSFEIPSDSDLESLWRDSQGNYQFTNVRDSKSVRWYSSNRVMLSLYDESRLVAWALFGQIEHHKYQTNELWLQDLWLLSRADLTNVLKVLMVAIDEHARKLKVTLVRVPHFSSEMSIVIKSLGLKELAYNHTGYVRMSRDQDYGFDPDHSWFTMLQGDYNT
jgi:hypothetical protein